MPRVCRRRGGRERVCAEPTLRHTAPVPRPALTFFNEQDTPALAGTFRPEVHASLRRLEARVAMGLKDLSDERAYVVRSLLDDGVPVTGWLLLPRDQGYFATLENVDAVCAGVERFFEWRARHHLAIDRLGLDFEPPIADLDVLMAKPLVTMPRWLARRGRRALVDAAKRRYQALIGELRARGLEVETYQFPFLLDDRAVRSDFWQRMLGALDVEADHEVVMLYSSLMGPVGYGLLQAYASQARGIAVGSTGGGIDPFPKLSAVELHRDLRLAARHTRHVSVFSLEGCVSRQLLDGLISMDWDEPLDSSVVQQVVGGVLARALRVLARW